MMVEPEEPPQPGSIEERQRYFQQDAALKGERITELEAKLATIKRQAEDATEYVLAGMLREARAKHTRAVTDLALAEDCGASQEYCIYAGSLCRKHANYQLTQARAEIERLMGEIAQSDRTWLLAIDDTCQLSDPELVLWKTDLHGLVIRRRVEAGRKGG